MGALYLLLRQPQQAPPDFLEWPAGEQRKVQFFEFLRPILESRNEALLADRARLEQIAAGLPDTRPGWFERRWLDDLARAYRLDPQAEPLEDLVAELLLRVDMVPVSLALAQAAKESGWGTSRFAVEGHAYFGQWCYEAGCGLVPLARGDAQRHEVMAFASPEEAVTAYLMNLNSHPQYQAMRQQRARLRASGERVSGFRLATGLTSYSERRGAYVTEIQELIRFNDLGPVPPKEQP